VEIELSLELANLGIQNSEQSWVTLNVVPESSMTPLRVTGGSLQLLVPNDVGALFLKDRVIKASLSVGER